MVIIASRAVTTASAFPHQSMSEIAQCIVQLHSNTSVGASVSMGSTTSYMYIYVCCTWVTERYTEELQRFCVT